MNRRRFAVVLAAGLLTASAAIQAQTRWDLPTA